MKVLQIGARGVYRYSDPIYEYTKDRDKGIQISNMAFGSSPMLGSALPLTVHTFLRIYGGYDIVHNLSGYPFFPLKTGQIFASTAHEMQPILYPELTKMRVANSFKDFLWDKIIVDFGLYSQLRSDYIFANSQLTREGLLKAGFPKERIFLTPLGLEKQFLTPIKKRKQNRTFTVGSLGGLSVQKNAAFAIEAFRKIKDTGVRLEIWGKNYYGAALDGMMGGDNRMTYHGRAPEDRIVDIYDSLDAFAFTTRFDGYGLPIMEAKARGLPVIVWKHGHISREVRRYCFEAEDHDHFGQIVEQLKSNGYNEKLKKKAMADARSFTCDRMADQTIAAYKKMMS